MNQLEFANHIGMTPGYVSQLKSAGRLVMLDDGSVDAEASLKLMADTESPYHVGVSERHEEDRKTKVSSKSIDNEKLDEISARSRKLIQSYNAKTAQYAALTAEMNYNKAVGLLLDASEVRFAIADGDAIIRNRLESLPDILAPQLAAEHDEQKIRLMMADQIETLLSELSRSFQAMAKQP